MHFKRPGIFLRWNSSLWQVDLVEVLVWNNILRLVMLAVHDSSFTFFSTPQFTIFRVSCFVAWKSKV